MGNFAHKIMFVEPDEVVVVRHDCIIQLTTDNVLHVQVISVANAMSYPHLVPLGRGHDEAGDGLLVKRAVAGWGADQGLCNGHHRH